MSRDSSRPAAAPTKGQQPRPRAALLGAVVVIESLHLLGWMFLGALLSPRLPRPALFALALGTTVGVGWLTVNVLRVTLRRSGRPLVVFGAAVLGMQVFDFSSTTRHWLHAALQGDLDDASIGQVVSARWAGFVRLPRARLGDPSSAASIHVATLSAPGNRDSARTTKYVTYEDVAPIHEPGDQGPASLWACRDQDSYKNVYEDPDTGKAVWDGFFTDATVAGFVDVAPTSFQEAFARAARDGIAVPPDVRCVFGTPATTLAEYRKQTTMRLLPFPIGFWLAVTLLGALVTKSAAVRVAS